MEGAGDPSSVERDDRDQVEQVDEEADERHRREPPRIGHFRSDVDRERRERAENRPRDRKPSFAPRIVRHLLHRDHRSHQRDEHGNRHRQALSLCFEHMSHLMDEEQRDEADAEPPPADPHVQRERHEHREEKLELEQNHTELRQERLRLLKASIRYQDVEVA